VAIEGVTTAAEAASSPTRTRVFLSYARADQPQAARLAQALKSAGLDLWWDALIEGGAVFSRQIETALENSKAVIVLWSKTSIDSDWVLDEAARGRDLRKLVPVSLDGVEAPLGFRQYHAISLQHWNGKPDAEQISQILRAVASGARHETPEAGPATARTRISRRSVIVGASAAVLAGAGGVLAWRGLRRPAAAAPTANTVAVLPFRNLSDDPEQAYFADGLSEELRATLARNQDLLVMAQASSAVFREHTEDAVAIAAKLGVAHLLEGAVRRSGSVVRVTADLIDGGTGFSNWSRTFEKELKDIFSVQSEIADTVAGEIASRVSPDGAGARARHATATAGGTANVAAYDLYLKGRALYDSSIDEASERAALAQFDAAIAVDPDYAAAYAARARSLTAIANQYGRVNELGGLYDAAIEAARRAIEIAPDLADAHSTLGYTLFQGRLDARAAREPFELSRKLGGGEATVLARYAQYSARTGRKREAAEAIDRALRLDRLNPLIHRAAGTIAYAARNYGDAIAHLRRALTMNPRMSQAHAGIGDALQMLGRLPEALAEYAAEPVADFRLTGLAVALHRQRRQAEAEAAFARLVTEQGDRVLYQQAQVLAQWGRRNEALGCLDRAFRAGDSGLIYARNDPFLDPLRQDGRFVQLLKDLGFD
jgi:TolB-like protein/tetratricopeptide (TPR) repeat protein